MVFHSDFYNSFLLLFILLNPFLMSIYLLDLIQDLSIAQFSSTLFRAGVISTTVFLLLAWIGDEFFENVFGVRYAAFLFFGGLIFLIIGIRYIFQGSEAIRKMRGDAKHLSGSIALPFMIGPGTVNASILAGTKLAFPLAFLSVVLAMALAIASLILLKYVLDYISHKNSILLERYIDIVGRLSALLIGTIAVDMCMKSIEIWAGDLSTM